VRELSYQLCQDSSERDERSAISTSMGHSAFSRKSQLPRIFLNFFLLYFQEELWFQSRSFKFGIGWVSIRVWDVWAEVVSSMPFYVSGDCGFDFPSRVFVRLMNYFPQGIKKTVAALLGIDEISQAMYIVFYEKWYPVCFVKFALLNVLLLISSTVLIDSCHR